MAHEFNLLFFNGFTTLTPTLSLASQAMLVAARAIPVPQGEGAYWLFLRLSVPYTNIRKNLIPPRF